ncbi:hypothetical protein KSP39_PZI016486 [Platanthera zijinensis]|uniref:Uncharacterized protein n=1 Tax=Platanthera zijinensis TaxID=2320716 RepID=A0AAP0G0H9_9ASPA
MGDVGGGDPGSRSEEKGLAQNIRYDGRDNCRLRFSHFYPQRGNSLQEFPYSEVSILGSGWIDGEDHPRQALPVLHLSDLLPLLQHRHVSL